MVELRLAHQLRVLANGLNDRLVSDGAMPLQSEGLLWRETRGQHMIVDLLDGLLSRPARGELPVSLIWGELLSNSRLSNSQMHASRCPC